MKKNFTLVILLTYFISNSQCPAPSNIIVTNTNPSVAELSWTENGTATTWQVAVMPENLIETPSLELYAINAMNNYSFVVNALPPTGCNIFYVRSVCSATETSPWTLVANGICSLETYNYIASLSNTSFDNQNLSISPNPTNSIININNKFSIKSVVLYDTLGRVLVNQEVNQSNFVLDISNQNKGVYLLKVVTVNGSRIEKIVKE